MSMEGSRLFHRFIRRFLENQSRYFLVAKIILGIVGVVSVFAISGTVYAAGGVGSGGGGGGGGGGHQSSYGWGWAVYQTSGSGPTSGFRNGTSWSSVQSTCNNANAKSVYAFIIYDSGGDGEAYDYHTIYESPSEFAGHFKAGTSVDHSRATAINTSTAQNAFDSLPSKGVSTAGFTFGVNVAWFCYDLPSSASLDGVKIDNSRVSSSGSSSGYGGNYAGQQFSDDKVTVSGVGSSTSNPFFFNSIPAGTHTISVQDSGTSDTNWQVFGYSICKGTSSTDVGSCTTQWLTQSGNISGGSSFSYKFVAGGSYHMRWIFAPKNSPLPVGGGACPMQPTVDITAVKASFGAGNNGETTYSPDGGEKHIPPPGFPQAGDSVTTRSVTSYNIVSAVDDITSQSLKVNKKNNTVDFSSSVPLYPYDPHTATVTYTDNYTSTTTTYSLDKNGKLTSSSSSGTLGPSAQFSDGSASIGECYPIHFNVDTVTANKVNLNNYENPSTASLTSTVSVHLWGSQGGSKRDSLKVNGLTDAVSYTIRHLDGTTSPLSASTSVSTSCGGGAGGSIDCEGPASPSTSVAVVVGSAQSQLQPGDEVCAAFTISPQTGDANTDGNIQPGLPGQPGTASPSGPTNPSNSVCSNPVVNEPYFKVFGGDISAGDAFSVTSGVTTQCVAGAASASVNGWNTAGASAYAPNPYTGDANDSYAGAGAQFSLMAINNITGVASNQNNPNAAAAGAGNGVGLSFSNSSNGSLIDSSGGNFALGFGSSPSCIPDFYADKPSGAQVVGSGVSATTLSNSAPDTTPTSYFLNNGGTINGGTIAANKHVVVYAGGDVNITGPIAFGPGSVPGGSYASIQEIPSFVLVVKGNINISPSVTQLYGIYIAQPTDPAAPTDGTLSDCAGVSGANLWTGCASPLTVYGSFIANKIYLLRTGPPENGSDPYRENSSIRAAEPAESNSLSGTMIEDANKVSTCTNGSLDANGLCPGDYTPATSGTSGYYAPPYSSSPACYYYGDDAYSPGTHNYSTGYAVTTSSTCGSPDPVYHKPGHSGTYYSETYYPGSSGHPASCAGGETVSGSNCVPKSTYTYPSGCTPVPTDKSKCTIQITPTHASEVFNYNPAFWLMLSLQNVSSQNALKYDSIVSLPPVL